MTTKAEPETTDSIKRKLLDAIAGGLWSISQSRDVLRLAQAYEALCRAEAAARGVAP